MQSKCNRCQLRSETRPRERGHMPAQRIRTLVLLACFALAASWLLSRLRAPIPVPAAATRPTTDTATSLKLAPQLPPSGEIFGKVSLARGALEVRARVCATCASCEITGSSDQVCSDADAAGAYALTGLRTSGYRIT